ncbi:MAG TPA: flagellar assembly peptidoglycan hydrolase FlgJ [Gammaproteobacteria bacterium]|nr:flagellar assembly peptidoglycan hydrolase FlgJ [Gammaproteobacteria bacterium]
MLPNPVPSSVDLQALTELKQRAARDDPAALAEAAVQFEALFIGLMLESARNASLGEGILDGSETRQYLELMDQQVALELARNGGFGFGKLLVEQLAPRQEQEPALRETPPLRPATSHFPSRLPATLLPAAAGPQLLRPQESTQSEPAANVRAALDGGSAAGTPHEFVARFLPDATAAARKLGVEPRLLLAQAALETGWGEAMPRHPDGRPTNNLFGIKAQASWPGARVAHWTVENVDGVAERKRASFRAYPSSTAGFADYVDLIANTPRYSPALEQAHDPAGYVRAVTGAGYATDPSYAEKWLAIYRGDRLGDALADLKHGAGESTNE